MFCKNCGNEMDDKAIVCPKCGVPVKEQKTKKPIFKKWWFWVIVGVVVIAIVGGSSDDGETPADTNNTDSVAATTESKTASVETTESTTAPVEATKAPEIVYEALDLQTMLDELEANALKAEKTYQNKDVEVTGKIKNFDSDGSYISIEPVNADEWNFTTVMCYIKDDDQLDFLLEKAVGDEVTVKGRITQIGEILGYTIKMDEVK